MKHDRALPAGFWRTFEAAGPETDGVRLGPLQVWLRRRGGDWLICSDRLGVEEPESPPPSANLTDPPPEAAVWRRLGGTVDQPRLLLRPALPNRAVVVRPEFPFNLLPGEKVRFFAGVPLWLTLQTPSGAKLWEEPVIRLSNTWFGTPLEGELCYGMRTRARREGECLDIVPWRVVCPVRLRNLTKNAIPFERLCVRVPGLGLYGDPVKGIWASESGVTIREDEKVWTRVAYTRGAPPELENPETLASPREEGRSGFSLKSLALAGGWFQ